MRGAAGAGNQFSVCAVAVRSCLAALLIAQMVVFWAVSGAAQQTDSPLHTITVETGKGRQAWVVELASDPASRERGLMFRRQMARNAGMLFRFDQTGPVAMWMKNTFLPLDMIFLKDNGEIARVHRGAVPHSLDIITSGSAVRYVLELNAGEADRAGLKPGLAMRHPWFDASR